MQIMTTKHLEESLLAVHREQDKERSVRDSSIAKMRLELRARNFTEDAIDNEISNEMIDSSSELGRRSRRLNELDLQERDLYVQRYIDALAERALLLN